MTHTQTSYDVIIIGAGAAGLSAGTYAARTGMKTLVIERGVYGGLMQQTKDIENYPGFKTVTGSDLSQHMYDQAVQQGIEYKFGNVKRIEPIYVGSKVAVHHVHMEDGTHISTKSVIIGTGVIPKKLGIPGEEEFNGRGVSYCAICDGNFFKGKDVVVIGGGDSAVEEALYLSELCREVTVVHRRNEFKAQRILQDRLFKKANVRVIWDHQVSKIEGEGKVTHVWLHDNKDDYEMEYECDGVFVYVGQEPKTEVFGDLGILDDEGYIITDENMKTSISGIFAAGDVRQKLLRQIVTAAGDGSMAAISSKHYVDGLG